MGKSHRAESAPAQRRTTYAPGDCAAVLAPGLAIVLRARADAPLVAQLWEEVSAGGDVARVLPLLTSDPDAAHFALLAHGASGAVALVRGGGVVTVTDNAGATTSISGAGYLTWREEHVDGSFARAVVSTDATAAHEPGAGALPAGAGVVMASYVAVGAQGAAAPAGSVTLLRPAPAEQSEEPGQPKQSEQPEADVADEPAATMPTPEDAPVDDFRHLTVDDTISTSVEDAAVRLDEDPLADLLPPLEAQPEPQSVAVHPRVQEPRPVSPVAQVPVPADTGSLIDSVPGFGAAPVPAPTPAADENDENEHTIRREPAAKPRPAARATGTGPLVRAISCPRGHLDDPSRHLCRVCGVDLDADQEPVSVPRPVLGTLRMSSGDSLALDRDVVLGRSPSSDTTSSRRPHLFKVAGSADVSRNHVRIRLEEWLVLVEDLNSTNGTLVQNPGEQPHQLRPATPEPIRPGAVVTLADDVSFTFEVAE